MRAVDHAEPTLVPVFVGGHPAEHSCGVVVNKRPRVVVFRIAEPPGLGTTFYGKNGVSAGSQSVQNSRNAAI